MSRVDEPSLLRAMFGCVLIAVGGMMAFLFGACTVFTAPAVFSTAVAGGHDPQDMRATMAIGWVTLALLPTLGGIGLVVLGMVVIRGAGGSRSSTSEGGG